VRTTSEPTRACAHSCSTLFLLLGALTGCAIGVTNDDELNVGDSAARVSEPDDDAADEAESDAQVEAPLDAGSGANAPSDSGSGASTKDASAVQDAGGVRDAATDASSLDASPDATLLDAATDAATTDAGSDAGAHEDAGSAAGRDSGSADGGTGGGAHCTVSACSNDCSLIGPLRCCRENDTCGCSWAPGAYCM
jgi:hypothetical protein